MADRFAIHRTLFPLIFPCMTRYDFAPSHQNGLMFWIWKVEGWRNAAAGLVLYADLLAWTKDDTALTRC